MKANFEYAPIDLDYILKHKKEDLPEIIQIREKIKESFGGIIFKEDTHQYFLPLSSGKQVELDCVSNMTHKYVPHVDWDAVCQSKADKLGLDYETVRRRWDYNNSKATNSGTHVHEYGESWFYFSRGEVDKVIPYFKRQIERGFFLPNSKKEEAVESFYNWFFKQECLYPVLAETQVYTDRYAGTFDLLGYYKHPLDDSKSGLIILDFKTNNSLVSDYNRQYGVMLSNPFGDLYNEDTSLYTLQLSLYQIALENIGLKVIGRRLIWLKEDGTYELIKLNNETKRLREDIWKNG